MPAMWEDLNTATRFREFVRRVAVSVVNRERPRYQYATVKSIDRANLKCTVRFAGDSEDVLVSMGGIQPSAINQVVRIAGLTGDRYIENVMGAIYSTGGGGGSSNASDLTSGTVPDGRFPARLKASQFNDTVADANNALESGFYYCSGTNGPGNFGGTDGYIRVSAYNSSYLSQLWVPTNANPPRMFVRSRVNATWTSWLEIVNNGDSRLSDTRTPTNGSVVFASLASSAVASSGVSSSVALVRADDSRLSDTRTPTTHTHPFTQITGTATIAQGGTGATTQVAARTNLGALGVFSGSNPALTAGVWSANITHNLNTVLIEPIFIHASTLESVELDWRRVDVNNIQIRADIAVASSVFTVIVTG